MTKPFAWVIEDDPKLAEVFASALGLAGFEVAIINDARNAIKSLLNRTPALVTLDMQMPHVSGLDVLRQIRADERLRHIKVMVVTASAQAIQDAAVDTLADIIVMKPVALHQIVDFAGRLTKFDENGLLILHDDEDDSLSETAVIPNPVRLDVFPPDHSSNS